MKPIDPRVTFYFGVWTSILLLVASGTINFTGALPELWVPIITKWCGILGAINSTVLTAATGYSSSKSGPMVSAPAPAALTVVKMLLVAFLLTSFLGGGSANAAQFRRLQVTGDIVADSKANFSRLNSASAATAASASQALSNLMDQISAVQNDTVSAAVDDLNAADAAAGALTNPSDATSFADPIAHACYPALVSFLKKLPVATAATGKLQVAQLFEKKRLFVIQIQAGLPVSLKLGCSALVGDEIQVFIKAMSLVGVTVSTAGLAGIIPTSGMLSGLAL